MLEDGVDTAIVAEKRGVPNSRITINEAFYLATAGGGESLSLPIGRLQENYTWDVQIIDTKISTAKLPIFDQNEDLHDIFQKSCILYAQKISARFGCKEIKFIRETNHSLILY